MNPASTQPQLAAALFCEFSDLSPGRLVEAPLKPQEAHAAVAAVAQRGGILLESSPRRLYAAFATAADAFGCATEVRATAGRARDSEAARHAMSFRVLLGFGLVRFVQGHLRSDWTGRLPALAARLPLNAVGTTEGFAQQLGESFAPWLRPLRGAGEPLWIVGDSEAGEGLSRIVQQFAPQQDKLQGALALRVGGVPQTVRPQDCPVTMGRDPACNIVVDGETASRQHGRIEYRQGQFHYVDDSRNGSYVLTPAGEELFLLGDALALAGEGAISAGAPLAQQNGVLVRYACLSLKTLQNPDDPDDETRPLRLG